MEYRSLRTNLTLFAGLLVLVSCGKIVGFREYSTDIGDLPRLDISIKEDELGVLYKSLTQDASADCRFDRGVGSRSAGIRIRGDSSRMHPKKSFTLSYEEDGRDVKVALDSGGNPWFLHHLAMFAYRAVGLPAPELRPVALFMNESYLGYYSEIPMYSEELNEFFAVENGELFKFAALAENGAEKKFPDNGDYSRFHQLMANVDELPSDLWVEWCEGNFDLESAAKYVAVSDYLGIWDINSKNFYVYFGDRIRILPWDNDQGPIYSEPGGDDPITARLFESPLFREYYRVSLRTYFLDEGPENIHSSLEQHLDDLAALLDTAARNSPVFFLGYQDFLDERVELQTFLDNRRDQILANSAWTEYL